VRGGGLSPAVSLTPVSRPDPALHLVPFRRTAEYFYVAPRAGANAAGSTDQPVRGGPQGVYAAPRQPLTQDQSLIRG
jgi:hypothetical protein